MQTISIWKQVTFGAVAGLAGTMAIQSVLKTHGKISPQTMPPIRRDPGEFMVRKAKQGLPWKLRRHVSRKAEAAGAKLLGLGYGVTFGALYGAARSKTEHTLLEGALLGLAAWAAGYLGWLPGAKLMRPVWKQKPAQVVAPIAEHALYGIATVGGYRWLKELAEA